LREYRVLYFGNWGYGLAGVNALMSCSNVELVKVFSAYDKNSDNQYLNQVFHRCNNTNIQLVNADRKKLTEIDFYNEISSSLEIDFIISCCFDRIFTKRILQIPVLGAFNIHPSNLPKYRGIKPLENALANSEKVIGVTLHELTSEIDAGDILLQKLICINENQTFKEIYNLQCEVIEEVLTSFFKNPESLISQKTPQEKSLITLAPRLPFEISDSDTVITISQKFNAHTQFLKSQSSR
jgi:methionyl-tRNA formyltransferase